ncbi:uncharacterized protein LOC111223678 [Seriola dumerili]|uniref:uncharacterized protein LOC111223678 n=1 Tax=Seriola dumerili TaxID=41447 RepID=UPI000BBE589E|nr:uncharacterized protein LOC111223678 [Seriola dumerili]
MSLFMYTFCFLFILFPGQVNSITLHQSLPQIVEEGAEVHIGCSHNDSDLPIMLWYQQREDSQSMTLIVFGYATEAPNYEGKFKEQFELRKESAVKGDLIIRRANLSHSAVYLCAARAHTSVDIISPTLSDRRPHSALGDQAKPRCPSGYNGGENIFIHGQELVTRFLKTEKKHQSGCMELTSAISRPNPHSCSDRQMEKDGAIFQEPVLPLFVRGCNQCDTGAEAYFGSGTKLTVQEPNLPPKQPTVKVLKPSVSECRNRKDNKQYNKTLVCVASDFYPDHVSVFWQIDGGNVTRGVATDSSARRDGKYYRITSRLMVPLTQWYTPEKNFSCTVSFFNGNKTTYSSNWVRGIEAPGRERYLRITHNAKLSYAVLIVKSSFFGVFVVVLLLCKLKGSSGKQND